MNIPNYIIDAARQYADGHGGKRELEDAFIAGFQRARQAKKVEKLSSELDPDLFEECWKAYGRKGSRAIALKAWCGLTHEERLRILPHVKIYVSSRDKVFLKDFERYLSHKVFKEIIIKGDNILYDPEMSDNPNEYHPLIDESQRWDAVNKRLLFFSGDIDTLSDGYTDDTRPDGAKAGFSMYTWVWNRELKKWIKDGH